MCLSNHIDSLIIWESESLRSIWRSDSQPDLNKLRFSTDVVTWVLIWYFIAYIIYQTFSATYYNLISQNDNKCLHVSYNSKHSSLIPQLQAMNILKLNYGIMWTHS